MLLSLLKDFFLPAKTNRINITSSHPVISHNYENRFRMKLFEFVLAQYHIWRIPALCLLFAAMSLRCASVASRGGDKIPQQHPDAVDTNDMVDSLDSYTSQQDSSKSPDNVSDTGLSDAAGLLIEACNNYLKVNDSNPKIPEVLLIKASVYFNNGSYGPAREAARKVIEEHDQSEEKVSAIRMVAQSYYKEKEFTNAQKWYARLRSEAKEGSKDKEMAQSKISESIFRMAEQYEKQQRYEKAAQSYEEAALKYADNKIADVALFNAGQAYERVAQWDHATLMYQKLLEKYPDSRLVAKASFRMAKCHEKMQKWRKAANMYLKVVTEHPKAEFSQTALYNAGFAFENAGKLREAAATFRKMAELFPKSKTAPDLLFRAAELYGKLEDWDRVSEVTATFSEKYGDDKTRIVQALCMRGIALYMKDKSSEASQILSRAISTYKNMDQPGDANAYYAAKAQYTLGEMVHSRMNDISLPYSSHPNYSPKVTQLRKLRKQAITRYSRVIEYQITEWITRGLFQMGKVYEEFGLHILNQKRRDDLAQEESFSIELAIAQAVERYLNEEALTYHERNVQLGIDNELSNRFITRSREKLTQLPFLVADNYLSIVHAYKESKSSVNRSLSGFALVSQKLNMLQKIAPYKSKAINSFIKTLEMASLYRQEDTYYTKAKSRVTHTAHSLGRTYMDIAAVARSAPIPTDFDPYETFRYKIKLLSKIEGYVQNSVENFVRVMQVAGSYGIRDTSVEKSKERLAEILYTQARSYDILSELVFVHPPFPRGVTEKEKMQYRAKFEEIGLRLGEKALGIYSQILEYAKKEYAAGAYATHAYVRLYQEDPSKYGSQTTVIDTNILTSSPKWRCSSDSPACWNRLECNSGNWRPVQKMNTSDSFSVSGFGPHTPTPMWCGSGTPSGADYEPARELFFRREFYLTTQPEHASCAITAADELEIYINDHRLVLDSTEALNWQRAARFDLLGKLRSGKNVISLHVKNNIQLTYGVWIRAQFVIQKSHYLPQPPGHTQPLSPDKVKKGNYDFPSVPNFTLKPQSAAMSNDSSGRNVQ